MSFILDALKKSESERHRQSGPVLMDVRIAPPRRRIPSWAWVIAAVLLVNMGVLAWILWLSPANRARTASPTVVAATSPPAAQPSAAPPAVAPPAVAPSPATVVAAAPPAASVLPPAATLPEQGPVQQPAQAPPPAAAVANQNIDVATLPKVSDMVASGIALPELQLSWHVYDAVPQSRYVLLNGSRLREGDFTPDGVRVVAIAPTGVVVEWRGRRMFLNAGH
jgi:hypothetical protein